MPVFDFPCSACGSIFESLVRKDEETVRFAKWGKKDTRKLLSALFFQ
jgi:putative FmdB family regulatory protein